MNSTKTSCADTRFTDTRCADTRFTDTRCADTRFTDTMCADTRCSYKSCRSFIKPKLYHALMKENKEMDTQHREIISSLRNLNKKLIENVKEKEQENVRLKEENVRLKEENVRLEELGKTYLRTYTNMTIQLLILEEKVAKFEGRAW